MSSTRPAATARRPSTLHTATAPQSTPDQPALAAQAITAAQRQWAYRQRNKRAVIQAIGNEAHASRVTLLTLLGHDLALLDDEAASSKHSAARSSAERVISAIVTRYAINSEAEDRT